MKNNQKPPFRPKAQSGNKSPVGRNYRPEKPQFCPDPARDAAAKLIIKIFDEGKTLDDAMNSERSFADLKGRDRAFAAAIAKDTIRYFGQIEILINHYLQKPLHQAANYMRALLRTAVAQHLGSIAPTHAIIDRAVSLAKTNKSTYSMAGLANAILRKIITGTDNPDLSDIDLIPLAWRNRYIGAYGHEAVAKLAMCLKTQAPVDFTIKSGISDEDKQKILEEFGGELIAPHSMRVKSLPEQFTELSTWQDGLLWVQDVAASIPAKLINAKVGENVLDMCAAPGGKTMQLAADGANITAYDLSDDRLKLVAQNLARTNLKAKLKSGDAKILVEDAKFDAILLDAPCSATGTLRRNMETLWIKNPFDLPKLIEIQCELIRTAAAALKPGGRLVYAVCSLEPEEGDLATASAIEAGLKPDPILPDEVLNLDGVINSSGAARIMPYMLSEKGGLDGFFMARFVKP